MRASSQNKSVNASSPSRERRFHAEVKRASIRGDLDCPCTSVKCETHRRGFVLGILEGGEDVGACVYTRVDGIFGSVGRQGGSDADGRRRGRGGSLLRADDASLEGKRGERVKQKSLKKWAVTNGELSPANARITAMTMAPVLENPVGAGVAAAAREGVAVSAMFFPQSGWRCAKCPRDSKPFYFSSSYTPEPTTRMSTRYSYLYFFSSTHCSLFPAQQHQYRTNDSAGHQQRQKSLPLFASRTNLSYYCTFVD